MKKKSDVQNIFHDFIFILEKYYNIRVCIIHTNFNKFNSDIIAEYFSHIDIFESHLHQMHNNKIG